MASLVNVGRNERTDPFYVGASPPAPFGMKIIEWITDRV